MIATDANCPFTVNTAVNHLRARNFMAFDGGPISAQKIRRTLDRPDCPVQCYRIGAATRLIYPTEIQRLIEFLRTDGYLVSRV